MAAPCFTPVGPHLQANQYKCAASQTIAIGDMVTLNSSGLVEIADASSTTLLGAAASSVTSSASGDAIVVYDDPHALFLAQASASASQTLVGKTRDLSGATGAQKVNIGATSVNCLKIRQVYNNLDSSSSLSAAADGRKVLVAIALHSLPQ